MAKKIKFKISFKAYNRLQNIANEMNKDKTFIIKDALEDYLDGYADYNIALNRHKNINDKVISFVDMENKFKC